MIISIDAGKAFEKIQHPFMMKTLIKVCIEGKYLNIINAIYNNPTTNIIFSGEKLKAFLLIQEQDKDAQSCPFYLTSYWKS